MASFALIVIKLCRWVVTGGMVCEALSMVGYTVHVYSIVWVGHAGPGRSLNRNA